MLYVMARKLKDVHNPPMHQLLEDCTAAVNRAWQDQAQ